MEGHVEPQAYKDVVLFLATAGVVVPLFRRWKISPILGFLGAGVVLGPYGPFPVSGLSVGPDGTTVYGGTPAYGGPGSGTYTRCTGAVACGASTEVTVEAWGTR